MRHCAKCFLSATYWEGWGKVWTDDSSFLGACRTLFPPPCPSLYLFTHILLGYRDGRGRVREHLGSQREGTKIGGSWELEENMAQSDREEQLTLVDWKKTT